jgi:platelet-activating factor acetylhydrolase IB subunit beta/gamma
MIVKTSAFRRIALLFALLVVHAAAVRADGPSGPIVKGPPSEAAWGYYAQWPEGWIGIHNNLLKLTGRGGIDVVFLGDSITQLWDKDGKAAWEATFAPLNAANYGIGADSTRQVIWRLENGEFDGLEPKLVVLMIGTNNLYVDTDPNSGTDAQIDEGVKKILGMIQAKAPKSKILLVGVLPRQNKYFCDRIVKLNSLLSENASGDKIRYVDVSPEFVDDQGNVKPELFSPDLIHPNAKGYEVLAAALKPSVDQMLKH